MKRSMAVILLFITLTATAALAETPPAAAETAQSLYLQAGKAERQEQPAKARELYEAIIDRFPSSELAVKANDRLLELYRVHSAPVQAKPAPVASGPKAKARELLELKNRAAEIWDKERRRLSLAFFNRFDHRFNRSELREHEVEWDQAAEAKVKQELGMGSAEIQKKLNEACLELGITGSCDEKALK
ncbi:hypothetical protein L4X63_01480 [Geomonas sp. Red32]|uniref:hypothetical protein n=1 Tax=Geomonas sp. Red32 TaxID=2912856 RepID=UPI00202CDCD6|nr:hypothetical protein [Geomonas sp. Red32]MCM0080251.1 hypothetical protein [Geomonas sp. Red32]